MKYSLEFKNEVFQIFRWRKDFRKIINAIESNRHNVVRMCLEDAYDDPSLYIRNEKGKRVVSPHKKHAFKNIQSLYSTFMYKYEKYLDHAQQHSRA